MISFIRQLIWREFSYYLLYHYPFTVYKPLNKNFEHFPWNKEEELLRVWQKGETGYPFIDAGMRELWQTGFMHNRARMAVAFSCKAFVNSVARRCKMVYGYTTRC